MENEPHSLSAVYQRLFARCPCLCFPEKWSVVGPSGECRGCVVDPAETLAVLRSEFDLSILQAAGVIDRLPDGNGCLHPQLCDPAGAIIALRVPGSMFSMVLLIANGTQAGGAGALSFSGGIVSNESLPAGLDEVGRTSKDLKRLPARKPHNSHDDCKPRVAC